MVAEFADTFLNEHQLIWPLIGQRFEQHSIHHGEDCRGCADAEGECQDSDGGKARRPPNLAKCVSCVSPKRIEKSQARALPKLLFDLRNTSELLLGRSQCFGFGHPLADEAVRQHLQVRLKFPFAPGIETLPSK